MPLAELLEDRQLLSAGDLDATFGGGGRIITNLGTTPAVSAVNAMVVQPDGKVVVAGQVTTPVGSRNSNGFGLARYNPDGSPDLGFGVSGQVNQLAFSTTTIYYQETAYGMALQPDGKIIAVGDMNTGTGYAFAVLRLTPQGDPDPTFGNGTGRVVTSFVTASENDEAFSVVVQGDGKIVVGGESLVTTSSGNAQDDFALARYNTDGSLDTTFGTAGMVTTSFGTENAAVHALAINSSGQIIAAGSNGTNQAVARYNSNGSLDAAFGTGGRVTTSFGTGVTSTATGFVLQGTAIVVAGNSSAHNGDVALARYTAAGALDSSFGTSGLVETDLGGQESANSVVVQGSDLLVAGAKDGAMLVARYTANGSIDTTFGSNGYVKTAYTGGTAAASGVALVPAGGFAVAGTVGGSQIGVAEYQPSGGLNSSFGTNGTATDAFLQPADNPGGIVQVQGDGKIITMGIVGPSSGFISESQLIVFSRYTTDGSLDTTFGTGGHVIEPLQGLYPSAFTIDAQGRFLVAGEIYHPYQFSNDVFRRPLQGRRIPRHHVWLERAG